MGNFVRIDMESSACVQTTLDLFETLYPRYDNVGVVVQSYLHRSTADVDRLIALGAPVRLVKGAYLEPPEVAFQAKAEVDRQYALLLEKMLSADARANGSYTAIATHDARLIKHALGLIERDHISTHHYEFQMLYGIRHDLQLKLAKAGHRVRVYVSYGTEWYPYFMRRLAERPANLLFLIKNLFK